MLSHLQVHRRYVCIRVRLACYGGSLPQRTVVEQLLLLLTSHSRNAHKQIRFFFGPELHIVGLANPQVASLCRPISLPRVAPSVTYLSPR